MGGESGGVYGVDWGCEGVKVQAYQILRALERKHLRRKRPDKFFAEVYNGMAGSNRFDAVAIKPSWTQGKITGYEIKVNRQDFLADHKWPAYLDSCHLFYFVAPAGVISPDELDARVGLITYNPERGTLRTAKKAVFQDKQMDWEMLYSIVINRMNDDRYPFHNNRVEFFKDWLENKEERQRVGRVAGTEMAKEVDRLRRENKMLSTKLENRNEEAREYQEVTQVISSNFGRKPWGASFGQFLREELGKRKIALAGKGTLEAVSRARLMLEELEKQLQGDRGMKMTGGAGT